MIVQGFFINMLQSETFFLQRPADIQPDQTRADY